jgi:hypothetical protein
VLEVTLILGYDEFAVERIPETMVLTELEAVVELKMPPMTAETD